MEKVTVGIPSNSETKAAGRKNALLIKKAFLGENSIGAVNV